VICTRCQGLMTKETCMDLKDEMGIIRIVVLHCLNCGEVVDPLILEHRLSAPRPMDNRARRTPKVGLTGSGVDR
jgi:hypothetical protein